MSLPGDKVDRALLALVAVGIALRAWQYLGGASLWLDELALAHNLDDHGLADLLARPLNYSQVAPAGFLVVEWLLLHTLGDSEWSLRVLPFAAGLASVPLFAWLARRLLDDAETLAAVALFAVAPPLIMFSAILKPYAVDVLGLLAVTVAAQRLRAGAPGATAWWVAAGVMAPWFSNAGVLATAGVLAAIGWCDLRDRKLAPARLAAHAAIGLSLALAALQASRHVTPDTLAYFQRYWSESFPVFPPTSLEDLKWPGRAFQQVLAAVLPHWNPGAFVPRLGTVVAILMPLVCVLGVYRLWRRDRDVILILLAPALVVLVAAFLQRYPISNRLVLWLAPLLLLTMVAGFSAIGVRLVRGAWLRNTLLVALVGLGLYNLAQYPPVRRIQEFGPLTRAIAERWQEGDVVLLHHASRLAMGWYGPRNGFPMDKVWWSECTDGGARPLLHELDRLRGRRRAWFAGSNVYLDSGETLAALAYLDAIGTQLERLEMQGADAGGPRGAWAVLYDLSDPQRLSRAEAATFELPPPATGEAPWLPPGYCGGPEAALPDELPQTPGR